MTRIYTATRGLEDWRARVARPDLHWKRGRSAYETAVSWEYAAKHGRGIPDEIASKFVASGFGPVTLAFAIAEHKVRLPGGNACSQSDVWAALLTGKGWLSLSVEAKNQEPFGNETLDAWLAAGKNERSVRARKERWEYICQHLPPGSFEGVQYQLLHRCASAVIEAIRLGFTHASFVVQSFDAPQISFDEYVKFCQAMNVQTGSRDHLSFAEVGLEKSAITLSLGWADCPFATDEQIKRIAEK